MLACPSLMQSLQQRQETGSLTTKLGRTVSGRLTQGLVSEDGCWFYPIHEGPIHEGMVRLSPDDAIRIDFDRPIGQDANTS